MFTKVLYVPSCIVWFLERRRRNGLHKIIQLEEGSEKSAHRNKAIQRGASINAADSSSLLLDGIDPLHSSRKLLAGMNALNTSRGSNASSKFGYTVPSSFDKSFEGSGSIHPTSDVCQNQDQIRGRLTLPHLTNYQTKSLDIPSSQSSGFPNMIPGFSNASADELNQTKSLDISPVQPNEVNNTSENNSMTSMPRPTISIHIRKPTVKSSVHGK